MLSVTCSRFSKQVTSGQRWPSSFVNTILDDGATWVLESLPLEISNGTSGMREGDSVIKSNVVRLKGGWVRTQLLLPPAPAEATAGIIARRRGGDGDPVGREPLPPSGPTACPSAEAAQQQCRDVLVFVCSPYLCGLDDLMVSPRRPHALTHSLSRGDGGNDVFVSYISFIRSSSSMCRPPACVSLTCRPTIFR